jgi:hypothetical protein
MISRRVVLLEVYEVQEMRRECRSDNQALVSLSRIRLATKDPPFLAAALWVYSLPILPIWCIRMSQ